MAIYMQFEKIDGNVTAAGHEKWIEIDSCNFGISRGIGGVIPGRQTDREKSTPSFSEISISKLVDETSPKFLTESCVGTGKKVTIDFCETGDNVQTYLQIVLTNAIVSSFSVSGSSGNNQPYESISLNFTKIEFKYTPYDDTNKAKSPIPAGYDLGTAKVT